MPVFSQADRPMKITTKLGETDLLLHRFSSVEAISTPFEYRVSMLSDNAGINLKALLNTTATIALRLEDGSFRYINGKWRQLRQLEIGKDKLVSYEGLLVPSLWFLNLEADCRIFQNTSVPDIVEKILTDASISDHRRSFQKTYSPREYCVQYRESDFNFISRLMEEEGIFYFFEHTATKHTIVFGDSPTALQKISGKPTVRFSVTQEGFTDEGGIAAFELAESVYTTKISFEDYDFEKPKTELKVSTGSANPEVYDHPGRYTARADGERLSRLRLEEREATQHIGRGRGRNRHLLPGFRFKLADYYRDDANIEYTLISVAQEAADNNYRAADKNKEPFTFSNTFEVIPHVTPYRPPCRARKPSIAGSQTAVVVGKAGEDLWVDQYGRVKVQFFWDRLGTNDENSSCWVRVSQAWAGKQWGWVTLPRIGQEVIVDFLEGDPDRPIVTGRVYNADQVTPYTLPANQTQSGIKSRSSKGGGTANFNEIRFEDKKGSEMVTIHAEKDMETTVEQNDTQTIQNNRVITVDGTHTETITKDTTITIKQGNESITLDMGNLSTKLKMGNEDTKIDLGKSTTEAMQSIELKVGQSSIRIDQMGVTIKGMMIKIEGQAMVQIKAPMTQVNGDGMLILKGGITLIN